MKNAEREFLDSIRDLAQAKQVQDRIDANVVNRIPTGDARELDIAELMPVERESLFGDFVDTVPQ
jgi:hypothetical protein